MPTRYEDDDDSSPAGGDREISLGTGTVLGIFLALALVCSLFFGLGYSMGRKSAPSAAAASVSTAEPSGLTPTGTDKPSPASSTSRSAASSPRSDLQVAQPDEQDASSSEAGESLGSALATPERPSRTPLSRPASPAETASPVPLPNASALSPYVQVAAVSRKEDADLLLAALKKRGYAGIVRPQAQDKLLHIQVGPFATKKDAEAMRQRLITDGYNPILK